MSKLRSLKLGGEGAFALGGTLFAALLLVLTAMNAGPLWRDEVNTANVAQMPSLHELWQNLADESFPPLWPLLLRGCDMIGLAGSDGSIRVLGLYVGLIFLGCLWLCARWIGCRAPTVSIGLLGCLPAFVFIMGANRAYGLASCLLVLSFGTLWRMVERPSAGRVLAAGLACLAFAQCVYYDAVFLAGMFVGAGLVTLRRRQWKTLGMLLAISFGCAISLFIYLPIIRQGTDYVPMGQWPNFKFTTLWDRLGDALTARSFADPGPNGHEIWFWTGLVFLGLAVAVIAQWNRKPLAPDPAAAPEAGTRADLTLYCAVSLVIGVGTMMVFLLRLHYPTQKWYYIEMFCLGSIALDGLLGASWSSWRPGSWLRVGLMLVMMAWFAKAGWAEAHTRRSNVDLIAAVLNKGAADKDLIVVENAWEGITFNRYYHGPAKWATVPPIDSHLVHRNDLMFKCINQDEPMTPVLNDITNTLQTGHNVWLLGYLPGRSPKPTHTGPLSKWAGTYLVYWDGQVSGVLLEHCAHSQVVDINAGEPVSSLEKLPLIRFNGWSAKALNSLPMVTNAP